ncbi:helix-turn-helix domain-containing protein [Govanella unica]|uniref:Helix-turn-helix domain-containing protein n=1 Tax=Govanella unica TaxID=2975056 RepID=A0A9X3Z6Q4_9PROT|nr:helix-turn-helix domain-containing protein [Govania unica]MDA5193174.1 helix-turn-helix domain-containing protein [Govania unica]
MDAVNRSVKPKLSLLRLAEKLGSVTKACENLGYSRDSYYRFKSLYERGGVDALRDISRRKPVLKNRVPLDVERSVVDLTFTHPTWGQQRITEVLAESGVTVSSSGVRSIWVRSGLETFEKRVIAILARVQQDGFPLSPEQQASVERARALGKLKPGRFVELPGKVSYQDLSHMGEHPVLGPLHLLSFVDAYSHHAFATVASSVANLDASGFLERQVLPWYAAKAIHIESIRTDRRMPFIDAGRSGYKSWLRQNCIEHNYRLTRARAMPDAGLAFVALVGRELFQPLFRKDDQWSFADLELALADWLDSYNRERPQAGPSCYGKTPEKTLLDAMRFVPGRFRL